MLHISWWGFRDMSSQWHVLTWFGCKLDEHRHVTCILSLGWVNESCTCWYDCEYVWRYIISSLTSLLWCSCRLCWTICDEKFNRFLFVSSIWYSKNQESLTFCQFVDPLPKVYLVLRGKPDVKSNHSFCWQKTDPCHIYHEM